MSQNQRVFIDKNIQEILLFDNNRNCWLHKTSSVTALYKAYYYGNQSGYNVYFKGTDKMFFYKSENVRILNKVKDIDISDVDVLLDGREVKALKVEAFQNNYYRVLTQFESYFSKTVIFESNKYKDIFEYYKKLAQYAGTVALKDSPLSILSNSYSRISSTLTSSVLKDFLKAECKTLSIEKEIILPFDFNQSQLKAIRAALTHNISVIEGPPGTGKTQTILNLIANVLNAGKNCAVISNNNTAILNVYDKLRDEKLDFVAACLGNASNVQHFFEGNTNDSLEFFLQQNCNELTVDEQTRVKALSQLIEQIQNLEVETSLLESELTELHYEKLHYEKFNDEEFNLRKGLKVQDYKYFISRAEMRLNLKWQIEKKFAVKIKSDKLVDFLSRIEKQYYNNFLNIYFAVKLGIRINSEADLYKLTSVLKKRYYQERIKECTLSISQNKAQIEVLGKNGILKELQVLYRKLLESQLCKHYGSIKTNTFNASSYKYNYTEFLLRFPVILSTSQSLLNNAPRDFKFDYVIIDEASQGDLLSSVLALNCSRNLVVVGDSKQLQQIDEEILFTHSDKLAAELKIPDAYRYSANSILKAVKQSVKNVPITLLKEHYRCAPDIINFCNKMFYDGELVVMTQNTEQHIEIIKTVAGNHARSIPGKSGLYNQREIDEIIDLLKTKSSNDIGVITPFRCQVEKINTAGLAAVEADTVHKFQGRQKEELILSFVVNSLQQDINNENNRLYDFVTNPQLLNVAISRGRTKLTAIVADKVYNSNNNIINDFIKYAEYLYGASTTVESTISSVFDLLYAENTKILAQKFKNKPKLYASELLMFELISDLLLNYHCIGFSMHVRLSTLVRVPETFTQYEQNYILHPWTHVDFLFYNTVSKEALFALEVDGVQFHEQHAKQSMHDRIKDKALQANSIPIYRFKTNQSNEKQILTDILDGYRH